MFEDSLVESNGKIHTKKIRTVTVSAMVHVALITLLILAPLVFTEQIEGAKLTTFLVVPPPPPAPPAPPTVPKRKNPIRVGGDVQEGKLLFHPSPVYPALARTARIEGAVILQATIAEDGSIKDLRVIAKSNPLLLPGVVDTVQTWRYIPSSSEQRSGRGRDHNHDQLQPGTLISKARATDSRTSAMFL